MPRNETIYRIGCAGYPVERARYQRTLNYVEMEETRRALPRPGTVAKWRAGAPSGFAFGLVAPDALCDPGGMRADPTNVRLLDETLSRAAELGAVVRIHTSAALGPGPAALERFRGLLRAVDRRGVRIVWEPRGVLKDFEIVRWAERLDVAPVLDPFQDCPAPGPVGYFRIHSFMAMGGALGEARTEALAERIARYERAFVVFDTTFAYRDACALRRRVEPERAGATDDAEAGGDEGDDSDVAPASPGEADPAVEP